MNVQFAVHSGRLYVIEANPRASRTVPFVSKAIGLPLAKLACRIMLGERIADLDLPEDPMQVEHVSVKEAVLPFDRFDGADAILGPEMRSTGEVMGVARDFPTAFAKAQAAAGAALPDSGTAFITVTDRDKPGAVAIAQTLHDLGFRIVATRGTKEAIERMGIPSIELEKVGEGSPNVVDWIENGDVDLVVNTPTGSGARTDGWQIRRAAITRGVPCLTTLSGGLAAARAIAAARRGRPRCSRSRSSIAAARSRRLREAHRGSPQRGYGLTWTAAGVEGRVLAPLGRRLLTVSARREHGAYVVIAAPDPDGPLPRPGQFYMLAAAERWGGGEDERPFLPRAFSVLRDGEDGLEFMLEDVGPGTERLARAARPATDSGCSARSGAGSPPPEDGRGALLCGGGVGTAPLAILQDQLRAAGLRGAGAARLPRPRARARGGAARASRASRRTTGRQVTPASSPSCSPPRSARTPHVVVYACGPPPMLEAVRALCEERGVPAQLALESGMACGFGACFGCVVPLREGGYMRVCVDGPVRRGRAARHLPRRRSGPLIDFCGIALEHQVVNGSGTFDAIAARRAFGDALLERFPFSAFVSKTITLEPRAGNPPPRLYETPAGLINSIGLPNKGVDGYLSSTICRSSPSCRCR